MGKWNEDTIQRKSEEFAAIAAEYQGLNFNGLEEKYSDLHNTKQTLDTSVKAVNRRLAVLEAIFAERFTEQDIKSMNFDSGHRLAVRFETPLKVENKEEFIKWLKSSGLESELTIYDARLKSISKGVLEETGSLPPGIVQGDLVAVVSYTKSK